MEGEQQGGGTACPPSRILLPSRVASGPRRRMGSASGVLLGWHEPNGRAGHRARFPGGRALCPRGMGEKVKANHVSFLGRVGLTRLFAALMTVLFLLAANGCVLYRPLRLLGPNLTRARAGLYECWQEENRDAYQMFRELAKANGWRMYVACGSEAGLYDHSIGRLDFGHSEYEVLYKVPRGRRIGTIAPLRAGRLAFIEYTLKIPCCAGRFEETNLKLGVVAEQAAVTKVSFELPRLDLQGPLALGERYVFFTSGYLKGWLYDVSEKTLHTIFELPRGQDGIQKVDVLPDSYLFVLRGLPPRSRLVVLSAKPPHVELSSIDGVVDVTVVGRTVVIEKGDACFLYDPETGEIQRVAAGNLLARLGNDDFLFEAPGDRSRAVWRYSIVSGTAEPFWKPPAPDIGFGMRPGEPKHYDYTYSIVCPHRRFFFVPWRVPWRTKAEFLMGPILEYDVYDLTTGEKRGAFLNLYEGRFLFKFLGWADGEQVRAPGGERRE